MLRRIREAESDVRLAAFKAMVREQFYMLLLDTEGALAAIPSMLPPDADSRRKAFELIKEVLSARGEMSADEQSRLTRIAGLFGLDEGSPARRSLALVVDPQEEPQAKAS